MFPIVTVGSNYKGVLLNFLSAVMLKDYETALKYCKLILQYEPNNVTAKEFYPLILEKLENLKNEDQALDSEEDIDANNSSGSTSSSDSSDSDTSTSEESSDDVEAEEEEELCAGGGDMGGVDKQGSKGGSSSEGDATTGSYSSLEDDEAEVDPLAALAAKYQIDNMDFGNGNSKLYTSSPVSECTKHLNGVRLGAPNKVMPVAPMMAGSLAVTHCMATCSSNTTTDYLPEGGARHLMMSGGSASVPLGANSDSESPTEPVSMQTIAILRAKVVPQK